MEGLIMDHSKEFLGVNVNKVTLINLYLYQLHLNLLYALLPDAPLPLQSAQLWKTFVGWSIVIFE